MRRLLTDPPSPSAIAHQTTNPRPLPWVTENRQPGSKSGRRQHGRNKRVLSARERQVQRLSMAMVLTVFLLVSAAVGILVLYLIYIINFARG